MCTKPCTSVSDCGDAACDDCFCSPKIGGSSPLHHDCAHVHVCECVYVGSRECLSFLDLKLTDRPGCNGASFCELCPRYDGLATVASNVTVQAGCSAEGTAVSNAYTHIHTWTHTGRYKIGKGKVGTYTDLNDFIKSRCTEVLLSYPFRSLGDVCVRARGWCVRGHLVRMRAIRGLPETLHGSNQRDLFLNSVTHEQGDMCLQKISAAMKTLLKPACKETLVESGLVKSDPVCEGRLWRPPPHR